MPKKAKPKQQWKEVQIRKCKECGEITTAEICGDCKDRLKWNGKWRL